MLLTVGSLSDPVVRRVVEEAERRRTAHVVLDEDRPGDYHAVVTPEGAVLRGGGCAGTRPVGGIFLRHAVDRVPGGASWPLTELRRRLAELLLAVRCPVANLPANAASNYAKPYQLGLLVRAGFDIPHTLVTNDAAQATAFIAAHPEGTIVKGVSNVPTLARLVSQRDVGRLPDLDCAPAQFQEYIAGPDYRVHVVGSEVFALRLDSDDTDYRRGARRGDPVHASVARLPWDVLARCAAVTAQLGLLVSGIDLKGDPAGRLVALEVNPYPQFTYYEDLCGQPITSAVVDCLQRNAQETESGLAA